MGKVWGFNDRATAEKLKSMANAAQGPAELRNYAPAFNTFLRTYLGHPNGTIPGAARVFLPDEYGVWSWKIRLGVGEIYVHQRDQEPGATITETRHYKLRGNPTADGQYVKKVAYNLCPEPIPGTFGALVSGCPDSLLFCVEDINGDLYIVKVCTFECPGSSSSSSSSSSSAAEECDGTEDVCVLTGVKKTDTGLAFSSSVLHFYRGKFCFSEPGYCVEESLGPSESKPEESTGGNYININLCGLECDEPEPSSASSSSGVLPPSSSSGPTPPPPTPPGSSSGSEPSSAAESSSSAGPTPPPEPSSSSGTTPPPEPSSSSGTTPPPEPSSSSGTTPPPPEPSSSSEPYTPPEPSSGSGGAGPSSSGPYTPPGPWEEESSSDSDGDTCSSSDCMFCVAKVTIFTSDGMTETGWAGISSRSAFVPGAALGEKSGGMATGRHGWIQEVYRVNCYDNITPCVNKLAQQVTAWEFE